MPKRPPKKWMKNCIKGVEERSPEVTSPGAVCGNVWYNVMSEEARQEASRHEKRKKSKHY